MQDVHELMVISFVVQALLSSPEAKIGFPMTRGVRRESAASVMKDDGDMLDGK